MKEVPTERLDSFRDHGMMAQRVAKTEESALRRDASATRAKDVSWTKNEEVIHPPNLTGENEGSPPFSDQVVEANAELRISLIITLLARIDLFSDR